MPPITKRNVKLVLRTFLLILCGCIFYLISFGLIDNFLRKRVIVTTSNTPIGNNPVQAPMIAICAKSPFKNGLQAMLTKEQLMQNSINITKEILLDVYLTKHAYGPYNDTLYDLAKTLDIEDMLTADGHCALIRFKRQVGKRFCIRWCCFSD